MSAAENGANAETLRELASVMDLMRKMGFLAFLGLGVGVFSEAVGFFGMVFAALRVWRLHGRLRDGVVTHHSMKAAESLIQPPIVIRFALTCFSGFCLIACLSLTWNLAGIAAQALRAAALPPPI
ncbi:MAG: hypothetical protein HQL41_16280 [Alphaproteobacteria bacterium]|nr:hypothetical protein [Alphaproteobacteria bacterium]